VITFDASLLTSIYQAKSGMAGGGLSIPAAGGGRTTKLPTPPWDPKSTAAHTDVFLKRALLGAKFINLNDAQLDVPGASEDYRKLFALYQGLDALHGLADRAGQKGISSGELHRVQDAFVRGLAEIGDYTDTLKLDQFRLASGAVADSLKATSGVRRDNSDYVTGPIMTGSSADEVPAFMGDVKFNIAVKRISTTTNVAIDLNDMGAQPRTLANVIGYINGKLADAGAVTRFASQKLPNEPRTMQVGGKTVTLPAIADSWALKIDGDTAEQITFSAPATAGAVYLAQSAGKVPTTAELAKGTADVTERQILKFQTDTANVAPPVATEGQANWVDGRVYSHTLGKEVAAVRATATGADGSLYILADVTGATDGQAIQGERDVALRKYDSAGKLVYSRTLGAADSASGYALAVAADGKVAIAGSVTGVIQGVDRGPLNSSDTSGKSDSFVTLFNADGEEVWTERRGGADDDLATAVAFGDDGEVYVAGRTRSVLPGGTSVGGWDNYLTAYSTQSTGKPRTLFTEQFGSVGDDKVGGIAVRDNQIVVAGTESGSAVLRSFSISTTTVTTDKVTAGGVLTQTVTTATDGAVTGTQVSTFNTTAPDGSSSVTNVTAATATAGTVRNLGALQGGDVAGIGFDAGGNVIVAGTTSTDQLGVASANNAFGGGRDVFVARLSGDLVANGAERLSYYGGDGDDAASAVTVSGGQAWIAGATTSTSLGGQAKIGEQDGYVAGIDAATGVVAFAERFTAKDGYVAPTSIAVDQTGASVLDRLGLPKGTLDYKDSQLVTAGTSLRAGDQFFVRGREGAQPTAITIEAGDTLGTLAQKVRRAAGFSAAVSVVRNGEFSVLQIKPLSSRTTVEIIAGKGGKDALEALGLSEGVARVSGGQADKEKKIYGLKLSNDLTLEGKEAIKTALDQLDAALSKIRSIYRDLKTAATPQTGPAAPSGPVPAYLRAQLSNYQAGLARLTGGG
jgi:hypothetical protein